MSWSKPMPAEPVVAVVGATGAVGTEMMLVLEQRGFPIERLVALSSARSAGKTLFFNGAPIRVEELTAESFEGVDLALFSAGGSVSEAMAGHATAAGAVVIDNSSAFRMDPEVHVVVPEVNPEDVDTHSGIIPNPNCSTIQMVVALKPLHDLAPIKRVVVSTYQAASGAGQAAMDELYGQTRDFLNDEEIEPNAFAHRIAFNCIPQIDVFMEAGSTKEEWKMVVETKKIMHAPDIEIAATCVRVPVLRCHAESVNVEFDSMVSLQDARAALAAAPGVTMLDDPSQQLYPMPGLLEGTDETYVGRLRVDPTVEHGLNLWVVADQIRKGAALNAVQIAERLIA